MIYFLSRSHCILISSICPKYFPHISQSIFLVWFGFVMYSVNVVFNDLWILSKDFFHLFKAGSDAFATDGGSDIFSQHFIY